MVSLAAKRRAARHLMENAVPKRLACKVVGITRAASMHVPKDRNPELRNEVISLAAANPLYGCRRVHALIGKGVNIKAVHRIWKEERLSVLTPKRKPQ